MGSFLKKILELTEQDAFEHLTGMEKPCMDIFEGLSSGDALPSPNVGLPGALIPREPPGPAYVTHTGPAVRLLREREGLRGAVPAVPAVPSVPTVPSVPAVPSVPRVPAPPRPRSEPSAGSPEHPPAPPRLCHRIVFARKPPSAAPRSSSRQRE